MTIFGNFSFFLETFILILAFRSLAQKVIFKYFMDNFHIIQAIVRAALNNPTSALVHQVERLKKALEDEGKVKEAMGLGSLLMKSEKTKEMSPSRIERSKMFISGEELTKQTLIPVDKESATPIAEVIFPDSLPIEAPVFSEEVRNAIFSIINEWRHYERLEKLNVLPSKTCLIYGKPGTGKTHLALWLAKQINTPVVIARLDGLMSSFLGTTSRNIGNLFTFANRYRCLLLLDEFDAIAKLRNDSQEVGEIKRVVNSLLQNLDGRKELGITIGITNHDTLLDPAIWRRFEFQIEIPIPDFKVIINILNKELMPLEYSETEIKFLSWCIEGSSGADVVNMARWLKKMSAMSGDKKESIVSLARKFTFLNTGRIGQKKRNAMLSPDTELITILLAEEKFSFKQKEIAGLLGASPSSISKKKHLFEKQTILI